MNHVNERITRADCIGRYEQHQNERTYLGSARIYCGVQNLDFYLTYFGELTA